MLAAISRFDSLQQSPAAAGHGSMASPAATNSANTNGTTGSNSNANSSSNDTTTTKVLPLMILDLHRLLHCMEREEATAATAAAGDTTIATPTVVTTTSTTTSWQALERRMEYLQSQWQDIQHAVHLQLDDHDDYNDNDDNQQQQYSNNDSSMLPRWYTQYEHRVYRASQKAQEAMHALQRQENEAIFHSSQQQLLAAGGDTGSGANDERMAAQQQLQQPGTSLIEKIFFSEEKTEPNEDEDNDDNDDDGHEEGRPVEHDLIGQPMPPSSSSSSPPQDDDLIDDDDHPQQSRSNTNTNNNDTMDIAAFQKAQREQIEQAIAQMARQMKEETERIHSTLQGQTNTLLDEMEDIATENVSKVTDVTADVTSHVDQGWKRTFGTYTILFTVASLFLFSLMVIYMIPKYNSPASATAAVAPTMVCRNVNGKEECFDVNAWLTGSSTSSTTDVEEDVEKDDYLDNTYTNDGDSDPVECEVGMDGACLPDAGSLAGRNEMIRQEQERQQQALAEEQETVERQRLEREQEHLEQQQQQHQQRRQQEAMEEQKRVMEEQKRKFEMHQRMLNTPDSSDDDSSGDDDNKDEMSRKRQQAKQWREEHSDSDDHTDGGNGELSEEERFMEEELRRIEEEEQQQQQAHQSSPGHPEEESEEELSREKARLLKEREDRERLHQFRQMQQEHGKGGQDLDNIMAERERMRKEQEEQMNHREALREKELEQLQYKRMQRELEEQERLQKDQQELENHQSLGQDQQQGNTETEPLSDSERAKREFWSRQKEKQKEDADKRVADMKELGERRKAKKREAEEKERIRKTQEAEIERIRQQQQQDEVKHQQEQHPEIKGFGSFTSADSAFVEPESFGAGAAKKQRGFKEQELKGGFGANLPRGFGSFGKEDLPPKGVASAGGQANPGNTDDGEVTDEPEFRGKPFAPRDVRRAAGAGDVASLKDYLEQRPNFVNRNDKNDWGAIHLAIRSGHIETVKVLLDSGSEVNGRTKHGKTPLAMAIDRAGEGSPLAALIREHGGDL